jgi:hypothetical protein
MLPLAVASLAAPAFGQAPPLDLSSSSVTQTVQPSGPATRVDGFVGGQQVFSTTVPGDIGGPAGQGAVSRAGVAVTAASAPVRVRLSDPVFVGQSAPGTQVVSGTPTSAIITGTNPSTFAPLPIPVGDRGLCGSGGTSGVLGAGGALPAGCQNNANVTNVPLGGSFILTNVNTPLTLLTGTADIYAVTGTPVVRIGTTHALTQIGTFQDLDRLTDRVLGGLSDPDALPGSDRAWVAFAEAYGGYGRLNANPGQFIPGARSEFGGATGGVGGSPLPGLLIGWIADASRVDMTTNDSFAPESNRLDLFKTGPFGAYRFGDFSIALVGVLGRGDSSTRNGSQEAGGVASASYGLTMSTGGGEFSFDLNRLTGVPITPQFGYQYARVETDGFTESGSPLALQGFSGSAERQRMWVGAIWRDSYDVGPLRVEPRAYLRVINIWGDTDGASSAVFATLPGAGQVNLAGPQTSGWATQWGLRVRVPLLAGVAQVSYDGQAGAGYNSQVFAARMRFAF